MSHRVVTFEPGQPIAMHSHPGPVFATVVEGEIEMRMPYGVYRYQAGDTWTEPINAYHSGSNPGQTQATVVFTSLLPRGVAMSIPPTQRGQAAHAEDSCHHG